jgi:hypothetical protein
MRSSQSRSRMTNQYSGANIGSLRLRSKSSRSKSKRDSKPALYGRLSPHGLAAPVTMPPKKDEHGNWTAKRPCGDYRPVNRVILTDHYQLPTTEEIFDALSESTCFTTLDLRWGYFQVKVAEEDCCKTAFWGSDGLNEWVVMPFGLKNAPAFLQRIMDSTLRTCRDFARCYINDVIVYSKSFEEHLTHLRATFAPIRE